MWQVDSLFTRNLNLCESALRYSHYGICWYPESHLSDNHLVMVNGAADLISFPEDLQNPLIHWWVWDGSPGIYRDIALKPQHKITIYLYIILERILMYCIIMKSRYIMIYYVITYIMSHDVNNIALYSQGTGLIHTFFSSKRQWHWQDLGKNRRVSGNWGYPQ